MRNLLNDSKSDYEKLARIAASKSFSDNEFYRNLFKEFFKDEFVFDDKTSIDKSEIISKPNLKFYELLDYQYIVKQQAVFELSKNNAIGRKVLIQMPTGTGKTKTTMHIIAHYLNFIRKDSLVIWIAHTNVLLEQALSTFKNVWTHLGLSDVLVEKSWGKGEYYATNGLIFITIQSLQSMRISDIEAYKRFVNLSSLIIYDECHKIGAKETYAVINEITKSSQNMKKDFIGLTATPGRTTEDSIENRNFREFFDRGIIIDKDFISLIQQVSMSKNEAANCKKYDNAIKYFQDQKVLSILDKEVLSYNVDPKVIAELKKQFNRNSDDYSDSIIKQIANNRSRNTVILNKLKELNSDKIPTIVFACSLAHAQMLSAFLNIEGVPNSLIYGELNNSLRIKAIDDFKNGRVNVIINYDILTTGFDSTNIKCVFITRPTKSVILYSQMIGRGLRGPMMNGTEVCKLIDVKENLDIYNEQDAFKHFNSYWR